MKAIIFSLFGFVLTMQLEAQSLATHANKFICSDHQKIDMIFNDHIFIDLYRTDTCAPYFEILSKDSFIFLFKSYDEKAVESAYLFKVGIRLTKNNILNVPYKIRENIRNDTLYYYTVYSGSGIFRLFGFYDTDITLFFEASGNESIISLSEVLVTNKILSKKQAQLFGSAIRKKRKSYPAQMNKPCNILSYYFTDKEKDLCSTIILPGKPLRPFTF